MGCGEEGSFSQRKQCKSLTPLRQDSSALRQSAPVRASPRQSTPVCASPRQSTPVCTSLLCSGARSRLEQTIFSVSAPMFQAQLGNTDSGLPWKGKEDFEAEAVAKLTYIARSPRPSSLSSCNGGLQILRMRANQKALSPLVRMEVL